MDRSKSNHKWSEIVTELGINGLSKLNDADRHCILSEFQEERLSRIEYCKRKLASLRQVQRRRTLANEKLREERDADANRRLIEERAQRECKMREWLVKVKQKEAVRAKEKEELKTLAANPRGRSLPPRSAKKNCGAPPRSHVKTGSSLHRSNESTILPTTKSRSESPLSTTRSALLEYMKFSSVAQKALRAEEARYQELMRDSSYAQNVKLASTVYSRKLKV